jgi:hypothetical protein
MRCGRSRRTTPRVPIQDETASRSRVPEPGGSGTRGSPPGTLPICMDSDSGGRAGNATRGWSDRSCCAYADAGMEGRERGVCASSVAGVWPGPSVTLGARAERNWRSARAPKTSGSARDSKSWCPGSSPGLAIHTQAARDMCARRSPISLSDASRGRDCPSGCRFLGADVDRGAARPDVPTAVARRSPPDDQLN